MNKHLDSLPLDGQINDYLLTASGHLKASSGMEAGKIAGYGAAAGSALAMMAQAEAAVVANAGTAQPVTAAMSSSPGGTTYVGFDMNGDAVNDFAVFARFDTGSNYSAGLNGSPGAANNSVLQSFNGTTTDDVRKLASGVTVGPTPPAGARWELASGTVADVFFDGGGLGGWNGSANETGLAGVRFQIGGRTHYGWIRLQIDSLSDPVQLSAIAWAYESCPNTPIQTGATTGGLAVCPAPAPIPTLGATGYGLTALALGGLGLAGLRRRRQTREPVERPNA